MSPTRTSPKPAAKAASAAKAAPTPPAAAAPSKAPARVRRRARLNIPPTHHTPTPTPGATAAPTPTKADPKAGAKDSPTKRPAKAPTPKKPKPARGLSALDAAAKVLEGLKGNEAREGIQASDLIDRMQRASLWTSPGGKTPAATLYAAMIREIKIKKGEARFTRVSPGHFAFKGARGTRG